MGAKNICRWSVPLQPQRVKKKLNNLILRVARVREVISWKILWYTRCVITCQGSEKRRLWSSTAAVVHGKLYHSDCRPKQISERLLRAVVRNARAEWIIETEVCQRIFTNYEVLRLLFNMRELYDTPLVVLNTTKDHNWKTEKEKSLSDQISHARKCTHLAVSRVT